jgi:hypothetical protein
MRQLASNNKPPSNGIDRSEDPACGELAQYDDERSSAVVAIIEPAPPHNRNSDRPEDRGRRRNGRRPVGLVVYDPSVRHREHKTD